MKHLFQLTILASSLFSLVTFGGAPHTANTCISQMSQRVMFDDILNMNKCQLQDQDMTELKKFIDDQHIRVLFMSKNEVGPQGIRILAANNYSLKMLWMDDNHVGDEGVKELAVMSGLEYLDAGYNDITAIGAKTLATSKTISSLFVEGNNIADNGAIALAHDIALKDIDVSFNHLTAKSTTILAMQKFKELYIAGNQINAIGFRAIARNYALRTLNISFTHPAISDLAQIVKLPGLTALMLNGEQIGDKGVKIITQSSNRWDTLDLEENNIGLNGAVELAKLPHLQMLDLSKNPIGNDGAKALAATQSPKLSMLLLDNANIDDEGVISLASMPSLRVLYLRDNHIGQTGIDALNQNSNLIYYVNDEDASAKQNILMQQQKLLKAKNATHS